jgi:hypothetical protein
MGILPTCKVCREEALESPQHCLLECPLAKQASETFYHIWQKWGAPNDITLSWPFVMLGEIVFKRENDPPRSKSTMSDNRSTSFAVLSSTSFGRRNAESIVITSILLRKSFNKPGLLPLRLEWPLGRPLIPFGPPGTLVFELGLIKPLGRNGAT